jgi:hypothetical protein
VQKDHTRQSVSAFGVRSRKLSNVLKRSVIRWVTKICYLNLLRALEGTLSRLKGVAETCQIFATPKLYQNDLAMRNTVD